MPFSHLSAAERERLRSDAVRLRDLLHGVRNARADERDFALFDVRDQLAGMGVPTERIDSFDARDDDALNEHIGQAHAMAVALGAEDDADRSSLFGGSGHPVLQGGPGEDAISVTGRKGAVWSEGEAARAGLRGPQEAPDEIYHRTPIERFNDGWRFGGRANFGESGLLAANRAMMPPERRALAEQRYQASIDAYEQRRRADPWDQAPGNVFDKANAGAWTLGGYLLGNSRAILEDPVGFLPGGPVVKGVLRAGIDVVKDGLTDRFNGR
jgi:hypothetical protein